MALSDTRRRDYAGHIEGAGRPETRRRRVEKAVGMPAAGTKEPR